MSDCLCPCGAPAELTDHWCGNQWSARHQTELARLRSEVERLRGALREARALVGYCTFPSPCNDSHRECRVAVIIDAALSSGDRSTGAATEVMERLQELGEQQTAQLLADCGVTKAEPTIHELAREAAANLRGAAKVLRDLRERREVEHPAQPDPERVICDGERGQR